MIQLRKIENESPWVISQLANNYEIAKNLRDIFPHPYTIDNAVSFIELVKTGELGFVFGIYSENEFIGCCSLNPQSDVYRINAEVGYWIGEPYWRNGYATETVKLLVEMAFNQLGMQRVYANIFEYNMASMKVLEKVGFEKEAIIKSSVIKKGQIFDEHIYSIRKT